ncbi:MAG: ComEC family competence protein [Elusimicrobiota bacterium]|jgi:competence protein ComEC|nr:ComEC family competence protein [Elusimicrobiota bacterium]
MHISFYRRPLFLLLLLYAACLALFLKPPAPKPFAAAENAEIEVSVISYPQVKGARTTFFAQIKEQNLNAYVSCNNCPQILRGQRVLLRGNIGPVESDANFGSFNWAKYLARKNVFAQIRAQSAQVTGVYSRFWAGLSVIRNGILNTFQNNFDADLSAILTGITIGEKGDISRSLYAAFQDSGAMHLLVASGGNVGFVALIVYFLCSLAGAGRRTSAAAALLLTAFYTLIAGADAPLLRAYLMTLFATVGFILGRKSGVLQGFTAAALLILIINPQSLFEAGFQMSFLATSGIILLVSNFKLDFGPNKILTFILRLFFVSLAAQAALLPVFTNYFYKISFTAALSNILLVPLSGIIMGCGFFTWLIALLHLDFIFKASVFVLEFLLVIFKMLVEFFAGFALSKYTASALKPTTVAAYYVALFAFLNLPIVKRKILYGVFWCSVIFALLFCGLFTGRGAQHILRGRYADALLIKESGKIKIIGAGISADVLRKAVLASGRAEIECLFLNGNTKSASYALSGLEDIKIRNIYLPAADIPRETMARIQKFNAAQKLLEPHETACGITAANPWYKTKDGGIFTRPAARGNLSYITKSGLHTAGNMKDMLTAAQLAEFKNSK